MPAMMQAQKLVMRGAAAELQRRTDTEVVISGAAGTGKTLACLWKLHKLAKRYDKSRYLIVRKTRASLTESALFTYERFVLGEDNPMVTGLQRRNRQKYVYPNGSEIIIGGIDNATRIMSTEYDVVYVQEAIELTEDDWERLGTRLRNNVVPFQQIIADTNPDRPTHWLKRRIDAGRAVLLQSRHEDNPRLWSMPIGGKPGAWTEGGKTYIKRLDELTGPRFQRLRWGRWTQAEGLVYDMWNPAVHMVDKFDIPADWPRFRAVDFGFVHAFSAIWGALDEDGCLYIYRQWVMTHRTVREHAGIINDLSRNENVVMTVCDHDAEDMATLRENGIMTTPANKAVRTGIQAVQERLKIGGNGKPRLFVLRDSLVEADQVLLDTKLPMALDQEMDGYVWAQGDKKDEPVKIHDDCVDSLRYLIMAVDEWGGMSAPETEIVTGEQYRIE